MQLAYNAKTGAIGIRACADDAPGCYYLRAPKTGLSMLIGGKRFFKHLSIKVDAVKTYDATDFGNGIVGFVLAPTTPAPVPTAEAEPEAPKPAANAPGRRKATAA